MVAQNILKNAKVLNVENNLYVNNVVLICSIQISLVFSS